MKQVLLAATVAVATSIVLIGTADAQTSATTKLPRQLRVGCSNGTYHNGDTHISFRTMDWDGHDNAVIVGTGKGAKVKYGAADSAWTTTAKYASINVDTWMDRNPTSGMNDQGLRVAVLGHWGATHPTKDTDAPNVESNEVVLWMLQQNATTKEVVKVLREGKIDVISDGGWVNLPTRDKIIIALPDGESWRPTYHWQVSDTKGDVAVIEYVEQELKIYASWEYEGDATSIWAMTNDPHFDAHIGVDGANMIPNSMIDSVNRRLRVKEGLDNMLRDDVKGDAAMWSLRGVAARVWNPFNHRDAAGVGIRPTRGLPSNQYYITEDSEWFPTYWTSFVDHNKKIFTIVHYNAWEPQHYDFSMFKADSPVMVDLGAHPNRVDYTKWKRVNVDNYEELLPVTPRKER